MNKVSSSRHEAAGPGILLDARRVHRDVSILIVDDEELLRAFLRRGLRAEGYEVDVARDGATGLERALAGGCELVILDLRLPGLDGLSVLKALRARAPTLPVLILSAGTTSRPSCSASTSVLTTT
jgi:DNA-binding response OmpR family regulator